MYFEESVPLNQVDLKTKQTLLWDLGYCAVFRISPFSSLDIINSEQTIIVLNFVDRVWPPDQVTWNTLTKSWPPGYPPRGDPGCVWKNESRPLRSLLGFPPYSNPNAQHFTHTPRPLWQTCDWNVTILDFNILYSTTSPTNRQPHSTLSLNCQLTLYHFFCQSFDNRWTPSPVVISLSEQ